MYREMDAAGLPDSEYRMVAFMLYATIKNQKWVESHGNMVTSNLSRLSPIPEYIIFYFSDKYFDYI
jgi:hypothetical protein